MMYEGKLSREQLQSWVANRFYYQIGIPQKDAAIMSNCPDREIRRGWILRITDHDGVDNIQGGIEAWIKLGEAVGLTALIHHDVKRMIDMVTLSFFAQLIFKFFTGPRLISFTHTLLQFHFYRQPYQD
jgi:coenzyme PQQ biosynthesis protein C